MISKEKRYLYTGYNFNGQVRVMKDYHQQNGLAKISLDNKKGIILLCLILGFDHSTLCFT